MLRSMVVGAIVLMISGCGPTELKNTTDAKTEQFTAMVRSRDPRAEYVVSAMRAPSGYLIVTVTPNWQRQPLPDRRMTAREFYRAWLEINGNRMTGVRFVDENGYLLGRVHAGGDAELEP